MSTEPDHAPRSHSNVWPYLIVGASVLLGLTLMTDQAFRLSASYDEVTYLKVAADWWRTGNQESISRMGSPLTFWKIQQAPTLWLLDRAGHSEWVDDPIRHQSELLPWVRIGGLWIWVVALLVAAEWSRRLYGPRAMATTAILFALGPNLLAHGSLSTMETPLLACSVGMFFPFWLFLKSNDRRYFWATAALGGLSMSCKFTTVLYPPILGTLWAVNLWINPSEGSDPSMKLRRVWEIARKCCGRDGSLCRINDRDEPGGDGLLDDHRQRPKGLAPVPRREVAPST